MTVRGSGARIIVVAMSVAACARAREGGGAESASAKSTPAAAPTDSAAKPRTPSDSASSRATPPSPSGATAAAPAPTPTPSETVLTGKVVPSGLANDPATSLQVEGGAPSTLVGPLEAELRTLGGATVWVAGAPGPGRPNATFTVTRYEIVSIGGAKPLVGIITSRAGETMLAMERDTVRLVAAPAPLRAKTGAKVWVVGRRTGSDVATQTYGVIRQP